jgi:putative acyl-CoA dehydrogenase
MSIADGFITHQVQNQPPLLRSYNPWLTDRALREAVAREGGAWGKPIWPNSARWPVASSWS